MYACCSTKILKSKRTKNGAVYLFNLLTEIVAL